MFESCHGRLLETRPCARATHHLVRLPVDGLPYATIGTISQLLDDLVPVGHTASGRLSDVLVRVHIEAVPLDLCRQRRTCSWLTALQAFKSFTGRSSRAEACQASGGLSQPGVPSTLHWPC